MKGVFFMNIFYIHQNPKTAASLMTNKHVVKMILESAQMLSTTHRILDNNDNQVLYKVAYKNHPSTVWVRSSDKNYMWLYNHFVALCEEYTFRYGKTHLTEIKLRSLLSIPPINIPRIGFTNPPQCMPDQYKHQSTIKAYRQYYLAEKIKDPSYQIRFQEAYL